MERREAEQILTAIRTARQTDTRCAIATVVRIQGSAYRREGARIVVHEDGTYVCLLSGGCLEPAVADAAARVIATGEPAIVNFDLAEDSVWGLGIGCSGAVDVRIERVDDEPVLSAWLDLIDRGERGVLVTPLSGPTGRLLVRGRDDVVGRLGDARTSDAAIAAARERLGLPIPRSGPAYIGGAELFFDVSLPPPELVIFGGGTDACPLALQARALGFAVTVVDPREGLLTAERFPGATLKAVPFAGLAPAVPLTAGSYVVVMNHHLERDEQSLRHALASPACYIGVLGPRSRYSRLLARLESSGPGPAPERLACVRSPVGLALGAETPEEIALSILGELVALRRGFDGGFLNGRETSLHGADESRLLARS